MENFKILDKCRGSLVAGAVGDALGYTVEFMSLAEIRNRFGDKGITRYMLDHNGVAEFSDDTQMTLFTAEGVLNGMMSSESFSPEHLLPFITDAYLNWYSTQTVKPKALQTSWLSHISALWSLRAPGNTCLSSLRSILHGMSSENNSKGCGGVMRVAPIGIYAAANKLYDKVDDAAKIAAGAAEITHGHKASTLASALQAMIVAGCIFEETADSKVFNHIVNSCLLALKDSKICNDVTLKSFCNLILRALELAQSDTCDTDAIRQLGEGWVGDEALAIAVFSVMRYTDSIEDCIVCAVNHDGDSDSTGAIAGNIIGAIHGYSAIPEYYLSNLEIAQILVSIADDLCADVVDKSVSDRLKARYVEHIPADVDTQYLL